MEIEISGPIWFWRGPAPWFFVTVPEEASRQLQAISSLVTYGWGMIPVQARIGGSTWTTALFPKDNLYIVPIKMNVRKAENLNAGDTVTLRLEIHI
jgi:hypothetical protein